MRDRMISRRMRRRRNRKRTDPFWQRLPSRETCERVAEQWLRAALRWLQTSMPVLLIAGGVAMVATGIYLGYWFITTSEKFAISTIEVHGNQILSDVQVKVIAKLDTEPRHNIFDVDLSAAVERLEADPWITSAVARRELPNTVVLEISENQPAALVELDGLYLADARGQLFLRAAVERGHGSGLPVITGITRDEYTADQEAAQERIRRALAAAELYAERDGEASTPRPRLGEIHVDSRRGITFFTYDTAAAVRIGLGSPEILRARLRAFDAAWQGLLPEERERVRIVYADTSPRPDRVTVGFEESK